jgi:hypothetical protein
MQRVIARKAIPKNLRFSSALGCLNSGNVRSGSGIHFKTGPCRTVWDHNRMRRSASSSSFGDFAPIDGRGGVGSHLNLEELEYPSNWVRYPPIEEHGLIGNMHTCALVTSDATINWYCYPDFDSPSVFGSILDRERGGYFSVKTAKGLFSFY